MWRGAKQPYNKGLQRGMSGLQQEKSIKAPINCLIAATPAIHIAYLYYRVVWRHNTSELTFTLVEGGKELFSAMFALCNSSCSCKKSMGRPILKMLKMNNLNFIICPSNNFHDEFLVGHQKEPVFCRHESFSIGAFLHPEITHDKHERSFCKDLATEQKKVTGLVTSTADHGGDYKHLKMDNPISGDSVKGNNPKGKGENSVQVVSVHPKDDGTESKTKETDVEVSDDGSAPIVDKLDIEKHNQEVESEAVKEDGERDNTNPQSVK
ncbi:hypothetical protein Tco_0904340 [Tanacetum coccineum]